MFDPVPTGIVMRNGIDLYVDDTLVVSYEKDGTCSYMSPNWESRNGALFSIRERVNDETS
jgi:hypothetical protein